jgi:hypothetical protein
LDLIRIGGVDQLDSRCESLIGDGDGDVDIVDDIDIDIDTDYDINFILFI